MKRFSLNNKSIIIKLTKMMFVFILLQTVLLIGSVLFSGVVSNLQDYAYGSFAERSVNRKNYLQSEMTMRWSNIQDYAQAIERDYDALYNPQNPEQSRHEFLNKATATAIEMLRSTAASGAFIILDKDNMSDGSQLGIHIKDYDPTLNGENNCDLFFLSGPTELCKAYQIPLDSNWRYGVVMTDESRAAFDKPYDAARKIPQANLLGYWNAPVTDNSDIALTYSVPLLDKNNDPFGVVGVDITREQIYRILPRNDLFEQNAMGYVVALHDKKTNTIVPKITQGSMQNSLLQRDLPLQLKIRNEAYAIYEMESKNTLFQVLCHIEPIKLYNNNTPFEHQQWVLLSLADEKNLLGISRGIVKNLSLAALAAILIGTAVVYFLGYGFAKPIVLLAKSVRENSPRKAVTLQRTGVSEIDDLSVAIEYLNCSVLDTVLTTDKIIGMVNVPIGAFEYKEGSGFVTGTPMLFSILDLPQEQITDCMMDQELFFQHIHRIMLSPEPEEEDTYALDTNPKRWIQIKNITNSSGTLGVVTDVTKSVQTTHIIRFERDFDTLTGIHNRSAFHREARKIFGKGGLGVAAFVMLDLDNLKYVNDTYGHDTGDLYLKCAGSMLSRLPSEHTVVARMSGDEFYVFFHGCKSKNEIRDYMRGLYLSLEKNPILLPNGNYFKVRISAGISWYGEDSTDFEQLIRFADFAMYEGKHTVKGELREFDRNVYENESFMLNGKEEMNKILDNQLIEFVFQPIVSATTGEIYGYEALMRPQSDVLDTPMKLIQIAAAQSQLWKIEKITFFKALAAYEQLHEQFGDAKLFINSVPNQLLKSCEYAELESLHGDVLHRLAVEIIENEKLDEKSFAEKKAVIESWGASIVLDDYGAGYNSDISLLNMSPSIVKIDRLMINGIEHDHSRQSIIEKLIAYAGERGIKVLAEGVETCEQMNYLIGMGVDLMQGYYIGMPSEVPLGENPTVSMEIQQAAASR